jgi:DNA repair exonuclease SbcCD ATPase subunit
MSEDPEAIPVNHQAVIDGLTNTLAEIEERHQQLETLLKSKNSANKLHIAQLKGQIAALKRRKTEIESLLGAKDNQLTTGSPMPQGTEAQPKSPPKPPKR